MNANELADWLDEYGTHRDEKAATMLRQQQSEIEALKSKLAQADRVYDFDNPLLNSDDVGFKQIELNAKLLRKAQELDKIESFGTVNIGGVLYRNGKPEK